MEKTRSRSSVIVFILPFCLGAILSILGIRSIRPSRRKTVHAANQTFQRNDIAKEPFKPSVSEAGGSHCEERPPPLRPPRVLLYAFCSNSNLDDCSAVRDKTPGMHAEVYWKVCYAQIHDYDLLHASPDNIQAEMNIYFPDTEDHAFWVMVHDLNRILASGVYDYVYLMRDRFSINDVHFGLPVWAYDSGHDIMLMDQPKDKKGFRLNGILFKASPMTTRWFQKLLLYQFIGEWYVKAGDGAFLEMILATLGAEAESRGEDGYHDACLELACLSRELDRRQDTKTHSRQLTTHSQCFFTELDRLAGAYGHRNSKLFGFSKANISQYRKNKFDLSTVLAQQRPPVVLSNEQSLLPLTNCFETFRTGQYFRENCFGLDSNDPGGSTPTRILQQCPLSEFAWGYFYGGNDLFWFRDWSRRSDFSGPTLRRSEYSVLVHSHAPRVLIYTWCSENSLQRRANEVYWKACYAHAHGYDIIFTDAVNVTGVAKADEAMWAWHSDVLRLLSSGKYDYVFVLAADVLMNKLHLDFPVWAYDLGHDIILMDQNQATTGLSHNAILLKPTAFTKQLLKTTLEYRKYIWALGDTGAWMEALLVFLGREAEAAGRPGYSRKCTAVGKLAKSDTLVQQSVIEEAGHRYSECFFHQLDRLAGRFGQRDSAHIGFTQTVSVTSYHNWQYGSGEKILLRKTINNAFFPNREMPWANCFSQVRETWPAYQEHCFTYHWDEAEAADRRTDVSGECPDPSFNWKNSQWNRAKRNLKGKN